MWKSHLIPLSSNQGEPKHFFKNTSKKPSNLNPNLNPSLDPNLNPAKHYPSKQKRKQESKNWKPVMSEDPERVKCNIMSSFWHYIIYY